MDKEVHWRITTTPKRGVIVTDPLGENSRNPTGGERVKTIIINITYQDDIKDRKKPNEIQLTKSKMDLVVHCRE